MNVIENGFQKRMKNVKKRFVSFLLLIYIYSIKLVIQLYSIPLYERYSFMRQKFFSFNNLLLFEYRENEFGMQLLKFLYGATIPLHIWILIN